MNILTLDLPSRQDSVTEAANALTDALEQAGLPESLTFDVRLALQEALVNAVEHGNRLDETKRVHVTCDKTDDAVTLVVRDEGDGFDPGGVPDPTLPENILREHGRGLFLMRRLCDEVRFNPKGNTVTVVKKIPRE